jgi:hypothetical protein
VIAKDEVMTKDEALLPQLDKCLGQLASWLDKAEANATSKKYDVDTLLTARLAPDMYPFVKQVQTTCDSAKFLAARLTGTEAPKHPVTETSVKELRQRIAAVRDYLGSLTDESFVGAEARVVPLPFWPGKGMAAREYLTTMALPNFYFHYSMAYAILRHNGIDVGKQDYVGPLTTMDL